MKVSFCWSSVSKKAFSEFYNLIPWPKKKVTYAVINQSKVLPQDVINTTIRQAFEVWANNIPREFEEATDPSTADIKIKFVTGEHGDSSPFEKDGNEYAHADPSGILHFNDELVWKRYLNTDIVEPYIVDVLWVSLHELGHVLGLPHSTDPNSIMTQNYWPSMDDKGYYLEPILRNTDKRDIQEIYGPKQ